MLKGELVTIDGYDYDQYEVNTDKQIASIREYIMPQIDIQLFEVETQKQLLINQMITANALRDDVLWTSLKAQYDEL